MEVFEREGVNKPNLKNVYEHLLQQFHGDKVWLTSREAGSPKDGLKYISKIENMVPQNEAYKTLQAEFQEKEWGNIKLAKQTRRSWEQNKTMGSLDIFLCGTEPNSWNDLKTWRI